MSANRCLLKTPSNHASTIITHSTCKKHEDNLNTYMLIHINKTNKQPKYDSQKQALNNNNNNNNKCANLKKKEKSYLIK